MQLVQRVGQRFVIPERSWEHRDVLLYALGVGAGQRDPDEELAFTLERDGQGPRVLPTFGVAVSHASTELALAGIDPTRIVHAEQSVTLERPLPASATVRVEASVEAVYDKGSGALMVIGAETSELATDEVLLRTRAAVFVRGAGGFGGDRGRSSGWSAPERGPDHLLHATTRRDQALLYRLSGDRNPLHADPAFARASGFERPILHGLCTYGFTSRLLLHTVCGSDPAALRSFEARFSAPVWPGETLTVQAWEDAADPTAVLFQTLGADDRVVLDRGRLTRTPG